MYYSFEKLMEIVAHRGYLTDRAVAQALSPILGRAWRTIRNKIIEGRITMAESQVIASYFEMTPKEYCDCFLNGFFVEDREGHFIAHVENPVLVLKPRHAVDKKNTVEKRAEEILERIDEL